VHLVVRLGLNAPAEARSLSATRKRITAEAWTWEILDSTTPSARPISRMVISSK
jgi:hypothetical protein